MRLSIFSYICPLYILYKTFLVCFAHSPLGCLLPYCLDARTLYGIDTVLFGAFQVALVVKNLPDNAGDLRNAGSIPGSGRSLGGGNGNPLQYSCLENPMDRGAWWVTVDGVANSWTQLSMNSTILLIFWKLPSPILWFVSIFSIISW